MEKVRLIPSKGHGQIGMVVPALGGIQAHANIPENLGHRRGALYMLHMTPSEWEELPDGAWGYSVEKEGVYRMRVEVIPHEDSVDVKVSAKNLSQEKWEYVYTFTCFSLGGADPFADYEMIRTFTYKGGAPKRVIEMDRTPSDRPLLEFYPITGQLHCDEIPFIRGFRATCKEAADEGLMYILSRDGKMVSGVATEKPLYLFNNAEFSCVHACPTLGDAAPGEEVSALSRFYFLHGGAKDFLERVGKDFGRKL